MLIPAVLLIRSPTSPLRQATGETHPDPGVRCSQLCPGGEFCERPSARSSHYCRLSPWLALGRTVDGA
eukprot:4582711-Alexandrium_andersonii.AAC.1